MNKFIYSLLLSLTILSAESKSGKCPNLNLQKEFDSARYVGLWYEHSRAIWSPGEIGECSTVEYKTQENSLFKVLNTERVNGFRLDKKHHEENNFCCNQTKVIWLYYDTQNQANTGNMF